MSSATLVSAESMRSGAGGTGNGEQTCSSELMGSSPIAASDFDSDSTIPASRLMRERDQARLTVLDLRGLLAMAQTDRNRFERERDEAQAALTVSRNTLDDLTDHATRQGAYIAKLQTEANQLRLRIHHLVEELLLCDYDRLALTDLASGPAGEDCADCGGTGEQAIERFTYDGDIVPTKNMTRCSNVDCYGGRVLR